MRNEVDRLLGEAERNASQAANKVRVGAALVLLVAVLLAGINIPGPDATTLAQLKAARVTLAAWLVVGLIGIACDRRGIHHPAVAFGLVTADVVLIAANVQVSLATADLAGNFWPILPVVGVVPLVVGAAALRWKPGLTAYAGLLSVALLVAIALLAGNADLDERSAQAARMPLLFGWPPNAVRLIMLTLCVLIIVLLTWRGRALVIQAAAEAGRREALGRYLPRAVLPLILDPSLAELSRGSKRDLAVMFIDIRGSTAISARMEASAFADLLAAFREIIEAAVNDAGGVVDKFLGDGALILFGVLPTERDAALRALECANRLLARMQAFGEVHPAIRVGIAVHFGPVFIGVVGRGDRVEFTAIGDAVNVAARLEKATKKLECRLLVSAAALAASGRPAAAFGLKPRGEIGLDGVSGNLAVFSEA